jgi:hypothetical protein
MYKCKVLAGNGLQSTRLLHPSRATGTSLAGIY